MKAIFLFVVGAIVLVFGGAAAVNYYAIGATASAPMLATGLAILVVLFFYFLPTMVAYNRRHLGILAIALTNLVFGITIIGWIICMVWALGADTRGNRQLRFED